MSRFTRSLMILCLLPITSAACVVDGEDELYDDSELSADDEEVRIDSEASELEAVPFCQDLVLDQVYQKFCGFQEGPYDISPIYVQCTRTCVTERYITFDATVGGGGLTCNSGDTECTPWVCPPC